MSESTAASPTSSSTGGFILFPTETNGNTNNNGTGNPLARPENQGPRPDVYYLVLLGILVVLIVFAAILTFRGHRMRRRYRTATQMAIARGEPISWWRDDDAANALQSPPPGPLHQWANVGRKKQRRWMRIPIMWDAVTDEPDEKELLDDWDNIQPLTVHSRIPEPTPPAQDTQSIPTPPAPPNSVLGLLRYGFAHVPAYPTAPSPPARESELDRAENMQQAEPIRVGVVIQMPVCPAEAEADGMRREMQRDDFDDDEMPGWRSGMEIGVWHGEVEDLAPWGHSSTPLSSATLRNGTPRPGPRGD